MGQCYIHSQLRNSMSKFVVLFVVLVVCFSASNVQSAPKNIHVHLYNMRKFFAGATAAETETGKAEQDMCCWGQNGSGNGDGNINVVTGVGNSGTGNNNSGSSWG